MTELPKCKSCGEPMRYYGSMMTFHCVMCQEHTRGIFAWTEQEALAKLKEQESE